jgi:aryl carrier-like protein
MSGRPDPRTRVARLSSSQRTALANALRARECEVARQLVAYIVPAADRVIDEAEVTRWLRERLPAHMVPAAIVAIDAFPRLPNGKIDVRALPDPVPAAATAGPGFIEPRTSRERTLAAIWSGVLGIDRVGVHDNFFELGGDSILSIQVVARARKAGLRLAPDQIFEHQTLAALAASTAEDETTAAAPPMNVRAAPLTPIQAWLFDQRFAAPNHWHQAVVLEVGADFDAARFAGALVAVIDRHDALRLAFDDGQHVADSTAAPLVDARSTDGASTESFQRIAYDLAATTTLAGGPMLRAAAARDESGAVRHIVLCVHHLAIDAVSWPILLEDIADAYAGGAGRERAPSFVAWADALARATGAGRFDDDADYWAALAGDGAAIPHDSNGAFTEGSVETVEVALDADATAAVLHDIHGVHNTQIEDVLVTAIARTLATWLGAPRVRLGIERHGREALVDGFDLSRAVGWFTSYFPVHCWQRRPTRSSRRCGRQTGRPRRAWNR